MPSFLEYLDIPALQQAMAKTRVTQVEKNLAVEPKPALEPLVQDARRRAEAGRAFAQGERQLGLGARKVALEGQRLDLLSQQSAFERGLEPYALGIGALGVGTSVLGAVRTGQATRRQEARATDLATIQEQILQEQRAQTEALRRRGGALQMLYEHPTYYREGP